MYVLRTNSHAWPWARHCEGCKTEWDADTAFKEPSARDREEGHPHVHYNFEINESFRRDEDKYSASPNEGEITDVWLEMWKDR